MAEKIGPWTKYQNDAAEGPWTKYQTDNVDEMGAQTSPIIIPEKERMISLSEYEDPFVLSVPTKGSDLAATGVDVSHGAPGTVRSAATFARNEPSKIAYLERELSAPVRRGPDSGEPEYLRIDPETGEKRWALVDESALEFADFAEFGDAVLCFVFFFDDFFFFLTLF